MISVENLGKTVTIKEKSKKFNSQIFILVFASD